MIDLELITSLYKNYMRRQVSQNRCHHVCFIVLSIIAFHNIFDTLEYKIVNGCWMKRFMWKRNKHIHIPICSSTGLHHNSRYLSRDWCRCSNRMKLISVKRIWKTIRRNAKLCFYWNRYTRIRPSNAANWFSLVEFDIAFYNNRRTLTIRNCKCFQHQYQNE